MGGVAKFRLDVTLSPPGAGLRALARNSCRTALRGLRHSDVKERSGDTRLKLITGSRRKETSPSPKFRGSLLKPSSAGDFGLLILNSMSSTPFFSWMSELGMVITRVSLLIGNV